MRFKKAYKKYTHTEYWVASTIGTGQPSSGTFYLIFKHGGGFNLFRTIGIGSGRKKICHVRNFESAKMIANLMQNG